MEVVVSMLGASVASRLAGKLVGFYTGYFSNLDNAEYLTEGWKYRGGGEEDFKDFKGFTGFSEGTKKVRGEWKLSSALSAMELLAWTLKFLPQVMKSTCYLLVLHVLPAILKCNNYSWNFVREGVWWVFKGEVFRFEVFNLLSGEEGGGSTWIAAGNLMAAVGVGWIVRKYFP